MEIVNRVSRMASIASRASAGDVKIGLVSTMGAIHPGHISLIQAARKMTDLVVVSIFVSRLRFLSDEEFLSYPRDIARDVDFLQHEDVDYIFTPAEEEMYPSDFSTYVTVENYGTKLGGLYRDVYFRGMPTSILKMIQIVKPAFIFLGQKDGLQGCILKKMIRDLNIGTEVVVTPVVRDSSGLAYAARNCFLSESQKNAASVIYRSLQGAQQAIAEGETSAKKILKGMTRTIEAGPLATLEYAIIADAESLEPLSRIQDNCIIGIGVRVGNTSLDDSLLIERSPRTSTLEP